jgi:truncated hemoglobin YjbI
MQQEEGYLIDRLVPNVWERLGQERFIALSTAFYERVYADAEDALFRAQFADRPIAAAIQNQWEFFSQRMGGPNFYTQRKSDDRWRGHPALRARHAGFVVNTHTADRWLHHMALALDDVKIEAGETRRAMEEFFHDVAYFLRNRKDD